MQLSESQQGPTKTYDGAKSICIAYFVEILAWSEGNQFEGSVIISFLNEVVATTEELRVRFQYEKAEVAFWENKVTE